jgi:hypothetical protein
MEFAGSDDAWPELKEEVASMPRKSTVPALWDAEFPKQRLQAAIAEAKDARALRAASRERKRFSFINIKFFKSPGDSYPPLPNRSYDRRVLSNEGALLEAILKWDRARAGLQG